MQSVIFGSLLKLRIIDEEVGADGPILRDGTLEESRVVRRISRPARLDRPLEPELLNAGGAEGRAPNLTNTVGGTQRLNTRWPKKPSPKERAPMIELPCQQGSVEWHEARLGIPTASEFSRIVTPTGKLSAPESPTWGSSWPSGRLVNPLEASPAPKTPSAARCWSPTPGSYYAFVRDAEPREVGFIYRDDGLLTRCLGRMLTDAMYRETVCWNSSARSPAITFSGWPWVSCRLSTSPRCRAAFG